MTRLGDPYVCVAVSLLILCSFVVSVLLSRRCAFLDSAAESTVRDADSSQRKDARNARGWAVLHVWHLFNFAWFSAVAWILRWLLCWPAELAG